MTNRPRRLLCVACDQWVNVQQGQQWHCPNCELIRRKDELFAQRTPYIQRGIARPEVSRPDYTDRQPKS